MVRIRLKRSGSWLDPESAGLLGAQLAKRLLERVAVARAEGQGGRFLTLTYRRVPGEDARQLWRRQQEEKHVAMFMRRLSRALRADLRGKWLCKLEFQEDGYVHWHIILLGVGFFDVATLERCWGHGFVWIEPLTTERVKYVCKYVAKAGVMPAWLYGERPGSVRVVRVSHGFWRDKTPRPSTYCPTLAKWGPQKPMLFHNCHPTIETAIKRSRGVVVRGADWAYSVPCDPAEFIACVERRAKRPPTPDKHGWTKHHITPKEANRIAAACRTAAIPSAGAPRRRDSGGTLHLKGTCKSDADALPAWMDEWNRQEALAVSDEACLADALARLDRDPTWNPEPERMQRATARPRRRRAAAGLPR